MKFETNTAVTILRLRVDSRGRRSITIVKTWTNRALSNDWGAESKLAAAAGIRTVGDMLPVMDEGIYWARGHDDETAKALLVARALR